MLIYYTAYSPMYINKEDKSNRKALHTLYKAVVMLETRGDSSLIGDNGEAVGEAQMHRVAVRDANRLSGLKYTYKDRLSRAKSFEMFCVIQLFYNKNLDLYYGLRLWNGGPSLKGTNHYIKRYETEIQGLKYRGIWENSLSSSVFAERLRDNYLQSPKWDRQNHHIFRHGMGIVRDQLEGCSGVKDTILQILPIQGIPRDKKYGHIFSRR